MFWTQVRTRLGVAISEVSVSPVFHIKVGRPFSALPKDTTSELVGLFSKTAINAERQAGKLWIPFFKVFWCDSTRRMNPRSTDCEADALTTTPSRRFSTGVSRCGNSLSISPKFLPLAQNFSFLRNRSYQVLSYFVGYYPR